MYQRHWDPALEGGALLLLDGRWAETIGLEMEEGSSELGYGVLC